MQVTVVLSTYAGGRVESQETVKDAANVSVDGLGHLLVQPTGSTRPVAVYAPGGWVRAWTVDGVEFVKKG